MVTLTVLRLCVGVNKKVYYTAVQQMETLPNGPLLSRAAGSKFNIVSVVLNLAML